MAKWSTSTARFQSTLPAWGETTSDCDWWSYIAISIHSPRMGRDVSAAGVSSVSPYFNPLSPHGERRVRSPEDRGSGDFNPLSPHGERRLALHDLSAGIISIHSPRMGRDPHWYMICIRSQNFNPLSPHGERHDINPRLIIPTYFNPLSPHGERPCNSVGPPPRHYISIHSPRMGRDL